MSALEATRFPLPQFIQPSLTAPEAYLVPNPTPPDERHLDLFTSADPQIGTQVRERAQQLHTEVYLGRGFIAEADLTNGLFIDEYADRSTYFYAVNGCKDAAARQIACDGAGILSLPTAKHFSVDPEKLQKAAGVKNVVDIKPHQAVEISGLVARRKEGERGSNLDAVIALYSKMMANSIEKGHKVWLLNADAVYLRQLKGLIGEEQVHVLGAEQEYMGPPTVPVALSPLEITRRVFTSNDPMSLMIRRHFEETFQGISDKNIPKDVKQLLAQHKVRVEQYSTIARLASNPKLWIQAAIMGYSATRALPAATVEQFEGSTATLWAIDVATSIPYAWGVTEAFVGKSTPRRVGGMAVGATSFLAPYAYFYMEGNEYPVAVNAVVGGFIAAAIGKEFFSRNSRAKKETRLNRSLLDLPA